MMDKYFNYRKNGTDFNTEVRAGVTTFLTMAYILALNPLILSAGGFDKGAVFVATVLATTIACFVMAFHGKTWPIGLAPGMGLNAFVAFVVCGSMGMSPQEALGAVLVAGIVFLIISVTPIRAWIINSIPKSLKLGIGAGIGLFLAIIGFEIMGLTVTTFIEGVPWQFQDPTLIKLGSLTKPMVLIGLAALITMFVLDQKKVKGSIIISLILWSVVAWIAFPEQATLVPATKLNSIIASIPLVGDILVGKKTGEGVVGVSFKMKGPPKDIKTSVNPIKTITPRFILRAVEKMRKQKQEKIK